MSEVTQAAIPVDGIYNRTDNYHLVPNLCRFVKFQYALCHTSLSYLIVVLFQNFSYSLGGFLGLLLGAEAGKVSHDVII